MATENEKEVTETKATAKTKVAAQAGKTEAVTAAIAPGTGTWSWLGPAIPSVKLGRGGNFTSGFPERARDLYEKLYQVKTLLMPLEDSLETRLALRERDSFESFCYRELEEMVKRGEI